MSVAARPDSAREIARVYVEAWAIFRRHPATLLVPGVVLFVAFGIPSVLLGDVTLTPSVAGFTAVLQAEIVGFAAALLYYGYCEEVADRDRGGEPVPMGSALLDTAKVLPSLAATSMLSALAFGLGLVLFVLPGILLVFRFSLATAVVSLERARPLAALRGSFALTRGHARLLGPTAVAMICAEWFIPDPAEQLAGRLLGDHLAGRVAADAIANLLIAPMAGLVISVVYLRLRSR